MEFRTHKLWSQILEVNKIQNLGVLLHLYCLIEREYLTAQVVLTRGWHMFSTECLPTIVGDSACCLLNKQLFFIMSYTN